MITTVHKTRFLTFATVLAVSVLENSGCGLLPESTFKLATVSRLPKWITLPPGVTRADVSITLSYSIWPWGRSARFQLQDTKEHVIKTVDGKMKCKEPFQLKASAEKAAPGYPSYEAITVNGITDIIEHREMVPIFYLTDDPAVWKHYWAIGCG